MTRLPLFATVRALWRAERLSPRDLLRRAAVFFTLFLVAHLAGLREHTAVLSGSRADPSMSLGLEATLGSTYLVLYFLAVLGVPILLIAAAICAAVGRIRAGRGPAGSAT